jgi:hypothetical protein
MFKGQVNSVPKTVSMFERFTGKDKLTAMQGDAGENKGIEIPAL